MFYFHRNLYWMDMDLSNSKPKGRIFVSLLDGRYRKAVVSNGLERPTSLALDPEHGYYSLNFKLLYFLLTILFFKLAECFGQMLDFPQR